MAFYVIWLALYEFWISPAQVVDNFVINNSIVLAEFLLQLVGYEVFTNGRMIGVESTGGLFIGDPCNGMSLFALFTIVILAYPGNILKKLIFIPLGIITIHLVNSLRVMALCITLFEAPNSLQFNHDYTFKLLVWGYIFILWMFWANKLASISMHDAIRKAEN